MPDEDRDGRLSPPTRAQLSTLDTLTVSAGCGVAVEHVLGDGELFLHASIGRHQVTSRPRAAAGPRWAWAGRGRLGNTGPDRRPGTTATTA